MFCYCQLWKQLSNALNITEGFKKWKWVHNISTCSIRILNWNINSRLGELEWMWQNQFPGIARRHEEGRLACCRFIFVQRGPSILILKFDLMNLPFDWWITTSNRQPLHTSKSLHQVHISSRLYRTKKKKILKNRHLLTFFVDYYGLDSIVHFDH